VNMKLVNINNTFGYTPAAHLPTGKDSRLQIPLGPQILRKTNCQLIMPDAQSSKQLLLKLPAASIRRIQTYLGESKPVIEQIEVTWYSVLSDLLLNPIAIHESLVPNLAKVISGMATRLHNTPLKSFPHLREISLPAECNLAKGNQSPFYKAFARLCRQKRTR
jgi:hypothetical protein